jgi:hypothetical protein
MSAILDVADEFLTSRLTGDSTLMALITGVWSDVAPKEATEPFVVFSFQSGPDVLTATGDRILTSCTYLIKVTGREVPYSALRPAVQRVDTLLHKQVNVVGTNGIVLSCLREQAYRAPEVISGITYRHLGGFYRVLAQ